VIRAATAADRPFLVDMLVVADFDYCRQTLPFGQDTDNHG